MREPACLEVLDPGALATIQDLGRRGYAHLGVPGSGALDLPAHRLANRLVGNAEGEATIEATVSGLAVRVGRAARIAVTGAPCPVDVDGRAVAWSEPVSVRAGAVVRLGPPTAGLRSYLAVSGGVAVEPVLGSRSTDLLSGLGPAPLRKGDELPLGHEVVPADHGDVVRPTMRIGRDRGVLRIVRGPRDDWFTDGAWQTLAGTPYAVDPASNRIGLRLSGPPLARSAAGRELPSEPMVLGAVQVPPSGQPVVFLADHPTTGGYPVIGVVHPDDVAVCAQLRPGEQVSFRPV